MNRMRNMDNQEQPKKRASGPLSKIGLICDRFGYSTMAIIPVLYIALDRRALPVEWLIALAAGGVLFMVLLDFVSFSKKYASAGIHTQEQHDNKEAPPSSFQAFFTLTPFTSEEEEVCYHPKKLLIAVAALNMLAVIVLLSLLYPAVTRYMPSVLRYKTVAYGLNHFERHEQERTVLREIAQKGYAPAQTQLAFLLERGLGGPVDYEEAVHWLQLAHENGDTVASTVLGYYYDQGLGVSKDCLRAKALYELGAAQGDDMALNNLGVIYSRGECVPVDHDKAVPLFREAARKGNRDALLALGYNYEYGLGVERNFEEARIRYESLAEEGDPRGQVNLAVLLLKKDEAQNFDEALVWLEKALKQEDHNAINLLRDVLRNHPDLRERLTPYLEMLTQ